MLEGLLKSLLNQRVLVVMAGLLLLGAGAVTWFNLPVDAFPDTTNVQVVILTETPGMTPQEVERLVTFPIETEMGGLPNFRQVRSLSQSGLSQVTVIFTDDTDLHFARQLVLERLSSARGKLPQGITPEMGPIATGLGEIYQYVLEAGFYCPDHKKEFSQKAQKCPQCKQEMVNSDLGLMDLRVIQDWLVNPQLRRLAGINEINSFGGYVKQFHVIPDPQLLIKYGLTLRDILETIQANNDNAGAGFIVKDFEQFNVISHGRLKDINDIELIVLKASGGTPVYLKDVAQVRIAPGVRYGAATQNGQGETVIGMAIMLKDANSREVVDLVKAEIPGIQDSLPPGVKITPFYDRTDLIQACIKTVSNAMGQGVFFVVIILFILLWDIRAALTVAVSLPLIAAVTFLLMDAYDVTANLMSLGGLVIAIGLVVDGAIIVTENIARHMREQADSDLSRMTIAFDAIREVARPVIFAIIIIIVVFLPLFTLESLEGKMFKPMALTICFALLGSLIISLTIVPVLASMITKRSSKTPQANILIHMIHAIHIPLLKLAIKGRWITVGVACALMVGAFSVLGQIGTEFLPPLDEGAIAINLVRLPTASLDGSVKQCIQIEKHLLQQFPDEIKTAVSKTGRADISEDPMGPEQSDIMIMLKPKSQWKIAQTKPELIDLIGDELAKFPGIRPAFSQPIALRVNELISGIKSDVAIKIFGEDFDNLQAIAQKIAPVLGSIDGAGDVAIEQVSGFLQIDIQMNRPAMARHKINSSVINEMVSAAINGITATSIYEGQKQFDLVVRLPESNRQDISALNELLVQSPLGYSVPLSELVDIHEVDTPAKITRQDSRRVLLVECNVRGRDMGGFVQEAQEALSSLESELPDGYRLVWGGQFENQRRAMKRLMLVVPIALVLIFIMLLSGLKSVRSSLLIMVNLPFALIGGIMAIYLMDINLSVAASIGFIAVLGVAVEDGLVLVSFCDQLRKKGRNAVEAVMEACRLRIRPLIMTTLTTLLGLLPMLYATGAGSEIQKPLVAVIFGGLISSLLLELIVLPVLYILVSGKQPAGDR